jgi:cyclophilin family peptidyl-prolyl cis-trans isomerase
MARTSAINSATSQFFINNTDNLFLDHKGNHPRTFGYTVFGQVTEDSLSVVDAISSEPTTPKAGHQHMPLNTIIIEKAYQLKTESETAETSPASVPAS